MQLEGHEGEIFTAEFHPEGSYCFLLGSIGKSVSKIWNKCVIKSYEYQAIYAFIQ